MIEMQTQSVHILRIFFFNGFRNLPVESDAPGFGNDFAGGLPNPD